MTSGSFGDFGNIFKVQGSIAPPPPSPKYTHTYNSQSHSHHHRNHHMREPNLRIEQNRSTTYFKNKKLISCHGTRHFAIQTLPSVAYMFFLRWMDGWMDNLQFYVLFNSISVISERCEIDNEKLCAMELRGSNSVR